MPLVSRIPAQKLLVGIHVLRAGLRLNSHPFWLTVGPYN